MYLRLTNGCLFLTLADATLAIGLQVFVLQSQPELTRKVNAREAGGTSNTHANFKAEISPIEIDSAGIGVVSAPPRREEGRFKSTYAHRNLLRGSPREVDRGGEKQPPKRFESSKAPAHVRAGTSPGEVSGSGRAVASLPRQRESGSVKSSIDKEPVRTERKVAALGTEVGLMNVGPRSRNNPRTESYASIVARTHQASSAGILGPCCHQSQSNYRPDTRGGAGV